MNTDAERARLIRHSRKKQWLGASMPACLFCGCDRIEALLGFPFENLPERIKRKLIEGHHADGQCVSEWIVPLCLNCHAIESDAQQDLPRALRAPRTLEERAAVLVVSDIRLWTRLCEVGQNRIAMLRREMEALLGISARGEGET